MCVYLECVFFYVDRSICSFDKLKIVSDYSNLSQNLHLLRAFDKNTPKVLEKEKCFEVFLMIFYVLFKSIRNSKET